MMVNALLPPRKPQSKRKTVNVDVFVFVCVEYNFNYFQCENASLTIMFR